ncbi:MAG TPA: hypothetical protein VFM32_10725 [Spongiibacteraceae bacterium]|nr:hypothetical protein [Spongiibacteraceae bacterium]
MSTTLPAGFEALEPYVARWAISGTASRDRRRGESTEEERVAFFNAAKDLIGPALDLLDKKSMQDFDEKERRLMNLSLSFAHVALAVELLGKVESRHAQFRKVMRIQRSSAGA